MKRRDLLKTAAAGMMISALKPLSMLADEPNPDMPSFSTGNARWQQAYDRALTILAGNVRMMPRFEKPVLIEGADYPGIWQECGPHEALVYRQIRPDVARNGHMTFFSLQHPDGQLPANNKLTEAGFGQIQMVVPIAATAWEVAHAAGDSELLETAYASCSKWDQWLMRYRNTRGTGLVEAFCTFDTGMDNCPRWDGLPNQCPDKDARRCPENPSLPRLAPDLSATVYGGRVALAAMASALGKKDEADHWQERAETLRGLILSRLYDSADATFYDRDPHDQFVKVRSDIPSRICGEHVVDQKFFETLWSRQLGDPHAYWAPFPFPSMAMNDPAYSGSIPRNSWGGPSQALTALRAARWMDHYGRSAEFAHLMQQWCEAIQRDMTFRQQMNPATGEFGKGDQPGYSPAALVMYDFTWRLAGVHQEPNELQWNVRPGCAAAQEAAFHLKVSAGKTASMRYSAKAAELSLGGQKLATVEGIARIVTDATGRAQYALGIDDAPQTVIVRIPGAPVRKFTLAPNARRLLS